MRSITLYVRALRLPFVGASVLPYLHGALAAPGPLRWGAFALGLMAVACTHLSANLMNDVADARSGVDARDLTYYGFFGGSKLIQEGILRTRSYLVMAIGFAAAAGAAVAVLAMLRHTALIPVALAAVVLLAWGYSCPPLKLSYRRFGELAIAALFGPVTVCGAWFLQTADISGDALLLSLPHGLLVASILLANEVPDAPDDRAAGKRTLVVWTGTNHGWLWYAAACTAAAVGILLGVLADAAPGIAALSLIGLAPALPATRILKDHWRCKRRLLDASKLAILTQVLVALLLLISTGWA